MMTTHTSMASRLSIVDSFLTEEERNVLHFSFIRRRKEDHVTGMGIAAYDMNNDGARIHQ